MYVYGREGRGLGVGVRVNTHWVTAVYRYCCLNVLPVRLRRPRSPPPPLSLRMCPMLWILSVSTARMWCGLSVRGAGAHWGRVLLTPVVPRVGLTVGSRAGVLEVGVTGTEADTGAGLWDGWVRVAPDDVDTVVLLVICSADIEVECSGAPDRTPAALSTALGFSTPITVGDVIAATSLMWHGLPCV